MITTPGVVLMKAALPLVGIALLAAPFFAPLSAGETKEKDIFNVAAQKAAGPNVKKILFVGDKTTHGPRGNHEFVAGPIYMARTLNAVFPNCYAVVTTNNGKPGRF